MRSIALILLFWWLVHGAVQAAENDSLLDEFVFCLVCHGYQAQGNASVGAPALAGIEDWYIRTALAAYRSGTRAGYAAAMDMQAAARMLPEDKLADVLTMLGKLPPRQLQAATPVDAARLETGRATYANFCASCHGAEAEGNQTVAAPALRRLNDWYLKSAWQTYLTGGRGSNSVDGASQMAGFVRALPDSFDIDAVIAFLTRPE
jgi:cytochrome c553